VTATIAFTRSSPATPDTCPGAEQMTVPVELSNASGRWVFHADEHPSRIVCE
jgi:hypothetical protein